MVKMECHKDSFCVYMLVFCPEGHFLDVRFTEKALRVQTSRPA